LFGARLIVLTLSSLLAGQAAALDGFRLQPDDLPKPLLQQIKALGLTGPGGPEIPAFQWRLELKRPLRRAREIKEHFAGSQPGPNTGLSPTYRYDYPREPAKDSDRPSDAISVRGLVRVSPEDTQISARVEGLSFPLEPKASFKIFLREPGIDVAQTCVVSGKAAASQLHASLKGEAHLIECAGQGRYKGFDVKLHSSLHFIEALGMFFNALDVIDYPLGKLKAATRIVELKMGN
jgi:hypothetical protein